MNAEELCRLLGWCTLINFGVLALQSLAILSLRDWISNFHARMFRLEVESVRRGYFQYLANFKIAIIVFNLVPYIALKIISSS